jgi:hypothetical protein
MATEDADILFPDREITVGGKQKIKVRELAWPDARAFMTELAGYLEKLFDAKGEVKIDVSVITGLITTTDELISSLVAKTTGKDKAWLDTLPLGSVLDLIETALALNLSDELLAKGKKIAGSFTRFADARRTASQAASAAPTPS